MKHFLYIPFVLLLVSQMSCGNYDCARAELAEETQIRSLEPFTGVVNTTAVRVVLVEGTSYQAELIGPADLLAEIDLTVTEQTCNITTNKCIIDGEQVIINLTLPEINKAEVRGSGNIRTKARFSSRATNLSMKITGSGNLDIAQHTDNANLEITGSGIMTLYTDGQTTAQAAISGSGELNINGGTGNLDVNISGSGNFKGTTYSAERADITLSGAGSAYVQVNQALNATISGSGSIYYSGSPSITQIITGSGSVQQQ